MGPSVSYRIEYTYKNWIRKPDPSRFGKATFSCSSLQSRDEKVAWLKKRGHRVDKVVEVVDDTQLQVNKL